MSRRVTRAQGTQPGRRIGQKARCPGPVEPTVEGDRHRGRADPGQEDTGEVEMRVDDVELIGLPEDRVERRQDKRPILGDPPLGPERPLDRRNQPAGRRRVAAGEHGHIVAAPVELTDELIDDPLGSAVAGRRDGLEGRRDLGDAEAGALTAHLASLPCPGRERRPTAQPVVCALPDGRAATEGVLTNSI